MSFNFSELQQKADRVIHNANEAIKKWVDFIQAPAGDVSFQYYDKNGNLQTVTFPNRNKVVNDFIANVNSAMQKTFYIDAVNGSDQNDGSSTAPLSTIDKVIDSVPVGGIGVVYLKEGQTHILTKTTYKQNLIFARWGTSGTSKPKIVFNNYFGNETSVSLVFSNIEIEIASTNNVGSAFFNHGTSVISHILFSSCDISIREDNASIVGRDGIFLFKNCNISLTGSATAGFIHKKTSGFKGVGILSLLNTVYDSAITISDSTVISKQ